MLLYLCPLQFLKLPAQWHLCLPIVSQPEVLRAEGDAASHETQATWWSAKKDVHDHVVIGSCELGAQKASCDNADATRPHLRQRP